MKNLYYTPPSDDIFNEVKEKAIEIWKEYDNEYGYVDEKVGRIEFIQNIEDNLMYIVAMFDSENMKKLADKLSNAPKTAIRERLEVTGNPSYITKIFE